MKRPDFGRYAMSIAGSEEVRAFVPAPLPPVPPLELIGPVRAALDQALLALGRLDGTAAAMPDARLLLYTYVRKETVLSSQIEGKRPSGYRPPRDLTDRPGPGYCDRDDGPRGPTTGDDRLDPRQVVAREGQVCARAHLASGRRNEAQGDRH